MVRLELTPEEAALLRQVLDSYLSDLRMEIADRDKMDFREDLRKTKEFLNQLLGRLQEEQ